MSAQPHWLSSKLIISLPLALLFLVVAAAAENPLLSCETSVGRSIDSFLFGGTCKPKAPPTPARLQVILAGMPRSGSSSLKAALDRLGYLTLHGSDFYNHDRLVRSLVYGQARALTEELEHLGFNATTEATWPFWEDMLALRPEAKVILLLRDFDGWYDSMSYMLSNWMAKRYPLKLPFAVLDLVLRHYFAQVSGDVDDCVAGYTCEPWSDKHRAVMRSLFDDNIARAHEIVPPEQLLEMRLQDGDGYPKLCRFFGIEAEACPDEPFPFVNSRAEYETALTVFRVIEALLYAIPVALGLLLWWLLRRAYNRGVADERKKLKGSKSD